MVGGLWITDANFKSSIYLKNAVQTDPVTATPILYLSNGNKYTLPDVTLEPAGIGVIDINAALQQQGISPWATLSGYVEIQYTWPWDPLCATIRNVDTAHSLIFTYGLQPSITASPQNQNSSTTSTVIEGLWWKQESNVSGFVSVSNTTSDRVAVTVNVTDNRGSVLGRHTIAVSPHGTKIVELSELQLAPSVEGGIRVKYDGPPNVLSINGGLEDQESGYSATLGFAADPPASAETSDTSIAELGLMVGAADPMMSFPAATRFTPYSILRNVSDAAVSVTPTVWWMDAGSAHSAQLRSLTLLPDQTQSLDVCSLLAGVGLRGFNGSFNLVFDAHVKKGSLLLSAGSVDQSNTYVFEVAPRTVLESIAKSLAHWSTANGDDTMVTLWNPADEAQDLVFELFFPVGHYLFPIHLAPRATRIFNVSEIVHSQIPDSQGNLIPFSIQEGSAEILGALGENQHILVAADVGTYNVRKATCGTECLTCEGVTDFGISAGSFSILAAGGTQQLQFLVDLSNGDEEDDTNYANWTSNNTSVASVSSDNPGLVTGAAGGTAAVGAIDTVGYFPYLNGCGFYEGQSCPVASAFFPGGSATATVQMPTSLLFLNVAVLPNGQGLNFGCSGLANYGIMVDIKYQVLDQNTAAIQSANMTPHEQGTGFNGSPYNTNIGSTGFTNSTVTTRADGTFDDVPFGGCANGPFSGLTSSQNITMIMPNGSSSPVVRSQSFTLTGTTAGHGTLSNNSDISAKR